MQNDVSKKKRGVTRSILRAVKCKMMSTLMNTDVKRCHINTSKCVSSVSCWDISERFCVCVTQFGPDTTQTSVTVCLPCSVLSAHVVPAVSTVVGLDPASNSHSGLTRRVKGRLKLKRPDSGLFLLSVDDASVNESTCLIYILSIVAVHLEPLSLSN